MSVQVNPKRHIARKFNRAALTYDATADLQHTVGRELVDRLVKLNLSPERLLDLGAGTGQITQLLSRQYPQSTIFAIDLAPNMLFYATERLDSTARLICADFEAVPIKSSCMDLIFSNMSLQWSFALQSTLQDIVRCLRKSGVMALTLLVDDTLHELSLTYKKLFGFGRVNHCYSHQAVITAVEAAGAKILLQDITRYQKNFQHVSQLAYFLRKTGASHSLQPSQSLPLNKSTWQALQTCYAENFAFEEQLPATFTVLTLLAVKLSV